MLTAAKILARLLIGVAGGLALFTAGLNPYADRMLFFAVFGALALTIVVAARLARSETRERRLWLSLIIPFPVTLFVILKVISLLVYRYSNKEQFLFLLGTALALYFIAHAADSYAPPWDIRKKNAVLRILRALAG